jgi:hypothetical protein
MNVVTTVLQLRRVRAGTTILIVRAAPSGDRQRNP